MTATQSVPTPPSRVARPVRIDGPRLCLRELSERDVTDRYVSWMRDSLVNRYLESRFQRHTLESLRAFVAARSGDPDHLFLGIVLSEGDRHIGNIKLGPIDWNHRTADIGLLLGERDCWGRGYATEAIVLLARHAFDSLGVEKLTAGCYSSNIGSRRAFEKAGFAVEGRRRGQYAVEGAREDQVLLGRTRTDPNPAGGRP